MTRKIIVPGLTAIAALAAISCSSKQTTDGGPAKHIDFLPNVQIIYSANVNGEIEPCGCRSNPMGGIDRSWNFLRSDKFNADERLSVESGDLFYPSAPVPPFLEKQWNYQAEVLLTSYNAMGVEVMTPGELDFAAGFDQFMKLVSRAKFKLVAANIYRKANGKRLLEPYVILNKGGRRIGVFGVIDETLPFPEELAVKDHVSAAAEMVKELRDKADVIVALTHVGIEKDIALAKAVSGIDAIFGAHTQSFLIVPERVGDTMIMQPSFRGQHVGVYHNGRNRMFQVDERFVSKEGSQTKMDRLLKDAKAEIARINRESEAEFMGGPAAAKKLSVKKAGVAYQTFSQCAQCHAPQYEFHKNKAHSRAYETLVKAHQAANKDCLSCHTLGAGQPNGWKHVSQLVFNKTGKAISAESFAKSLPVMDVTSLAKVSKSFINVQCETCHGAGGSHPVGTDTKLTKAVSADTCLQCHTKDRAPGWYKGGKVDLAIVQAKLKEMTCPAK